MPTHTGKSLHHFKQSKVFVESKKKYITAYSWNCSWSQGWLHALKPENKRDHWRGGKKSVFAKTRWRPYTTGVDWNTVIPIFNYYRTIFIFSFDRRKGDHNGLLPRPRTRLCTFLRFGKSEKGEIIQRIIRRGQGRKRVERKGVENT